MSVPPTPITDTRSAQGQFVDRLSRFPWWALLLGLCFLLVIQLITTQELYSQIFARIGSGVWLTISTTVTAYALAIVIGLFAGLGRVSKNPFLYNLSTLYVQFIRGVPILVQLLFFSFAILPAIVESINAAGNAMVGLWPGNPLTLINNQTLGFNTRVIISLAIAYGGFEAETFRAGIESIGRGQMEAARSLGMSYPQAMIHVILPQAIRRVLPPLGNDLISMLKDSSLVSVLGINDMTNQARLFQASSFRYLETYTVLAFTYLSLTLVLSMFVKFLETRFGKFAG